MKTFIKILKHLSLLVYTIIISASSVVILNSDYKRDIINLGILIVSSSILTLVLVFILTYYIEKKQIK
jgi:hypothetical protein